MSRVLYKYSLKRTRLDQDSEQQLVDHTKLVSRGDWTTTLSAIERGEMSVSATTHKAVSLFTKVLQKYPLQLIFANRISCKKEKESWQYTHRVSNAILTFSNYFRLIIFFSLKKLFCQFSFLLACLLLQYILTVFPLSQFPKC